MSDRTEAERQLQEELQSLRKRLKELELAEQRSLVANERLQYLLDSSSAVIYTAETSGNYAATFVSRNVKQMVGYAADDFVNDPDFWFEHIHPDDRATVEKEVPLLFEHGRHAYEYQFLHQDGSIIWIRDEMRLIRDESGNPMEIVGFWMDITDHRLAEEALKNERDRLETVTRNMGAGLCMISKDYRVIWTNSVLKDLFGPVVGRVCYSAFNHRSEICPGCGVQKVFNQGVERAVHEQSGKDSRGIVIWSQIVATPIRNSTGRVTSALEVVIPITEHKKHLEEKARLKEQLQQAQKMEAVGTLAGGMAHDFNNLLTGILGQTEILLRKHDARDDAFNSMQVIQTAALQASELTRQLLGFARKGKFEDRPMDVRSVVSDVMAILKHTLDKRIVLECRLEEGDSVVIGDPIQLQQVLMNLAINARDAMPDGGKLTIETRALELAENQVKGIADASPGRYLVATVSDTGVGIPNEIRGRVFEPFFTTKSSGEGTGMGLAMAYGIVQDHGGWIELQSEAGNGTTFRLYLPLAEDQKLPVAKTPAPDLIRGEGYILVVDDEEIVRDVAVGWIWFCWT
jgi:PAS domain S-box-containing protein